MGDVRETGGSTAGSVAGFQVPAGIRKRKAKVDELLRQHEDVDPMAVILCFSSMDDADGERVGGMLDRGELDAVADEVRDRSARRLVQGRMKEIIRKKPGGGGYILYSPNKGKKKKPKPSGEFPTRLGAKRAELARFPPKDPDRLAKLRKQVDRLTKDPKKRAAAERQERAVAKKHESVLRTVVRHLVSESLFQEETTGSEWDERLSKLSRKALQGDPKLQKLQRAIEKRTEGVLQDAFKALSKATRGSAKLTSKGVKHSPEQGKTYMAVEADVGGTTVGPIFVYSEHGIPKVEVSAEAKAALMKADPDRAKALRAELLHVQERVLDRMEDLVGAIAARDKYLEGLEDGVDALVSQMSPLEVSVLKSLLVSKYRKQS